AAGTIARCILAWVPLMAGGSTPENLAEWKRLASLEPNRRLRAEYGGLALQFAELAGCREVWGKLLEGWNVEESRLVAGWIAKGEERGEKRGLEKGLEIGRREMLCDNLIEILKVRFRESLSTELLAALRAEESQERLSRWF